MKLQISTAALVLAALPALAQSPRTGVSTPDPVTITATDDTAPTPSPAKPSAAIPVQPAPIVYGSYVPYKGETTANLTPRTPANDPGAMIVTTPENATASTADTSDLDSMIVTSVPDREGELHEGTLLKVTILQGLSTSTTIAGSPFTASLVEPVEKDGRVILPVGSILDGQVTEVHSGRRISGAAALHLEPRSVTLPDGTHYILHAQLVGTGKTQFRIDGEGTLKRKDNKKEDIAVFSLATGAGAATGAMIGGGVGAIVGASIGAGVSTVIWLKQDRQATLPKDISLVFSLTTPMILKPIGTSTMSSLSAPGATVVGASQ
jgi:hypothetical protein